jgi:hypothetical protein
MRKLQAGAGIAASRLTIHDPSATVAICGRAHTTRRHQVWRSHRRRADEWVHRAVRPGVTVMVRASRLLIAVAFAVTAGACASGASIGQVKTNPGRYVDKSVTVRGVVTSSWGIPLVPLKMYQIDDGTGEILVVSEDRRIPSKGARVRVTGRVGEFAVFGGRSIGLHLRERDLDYDGR